MQTSTAHRLLWGIVVITIGVVFLLNQIGIISMDLGELFSTYWPVFMIVFGLQGLILQHSGGVVWNSVIVMIGVYFLGRNLNWIHWDFSDFIRVLAPVALILFGINMIFRGNCSSSSKSAKRKEKHEQWNPITPSMPPIPPGPPPAPPELDEFERRSAINLQKEQANDAASSQADFHRQTTTDPNHSQFYGWKHRHEHKDWWKAHDWSSSMRNNHSRFIGDVHLGNEYWELRPMSISHFIGDTTLDLTKAQISIGETRIYVSSFIGDVKVFVPNDFGVGLQVVSSCLIGDVKVLDQKRGGLFNQMSVETPNYPDSDKRIVLVVSSFIGDVRVTKVG